MQRVSPLIPHFSLPVAVKSATADADSSCADIVTIPTDTNTTESSGSRRLMRDRRASLSKGDTSQRSKIKDVANVDRPRLRNNSQPSMILYRNLGDAQSSTDLRQTRHPNKNENQESLTLKEANEERLIVEERLAVCSPTSRYLGIPTNLEWAWAVMECKDGPFNYRYGKKSIEPSRLCQYKLGTVIGTGSTGKVRLGIHQTSKRQVAIKIIPRLHSTAKQKSKESIVSRERRILREGTILHLIRHPHIVHMEDMIVEDDFFALILEYIPGEELLEHIVQRKRLSERRARQYFGQLLSAVAYCHRYGIVHRDLKIENILITEPNSEHPQLKLVDFGLSNFYGDGPLKTFCGSLYFAAPELLSGRLYCGPEVDVWSLGVILYVMVCGAVPFDDKSLSTLHAKIRRGAFEVPSHVSPLLADLIRRMMAVDAQQRISTASIMAHPWFLIEPIFEFEDSAKDTFTENLHHEEIVEHLRAELTPLGQFGDKERLEYLLNSLKSHPDPQNPLTKLYTLCQEVLPGRKALKKSIIKQMKVLWEDRKGKSQSNLQTINYINLTRPRSSSWTLMDSTHQPIDIYPAPELIGFAEKGPKKKKKSIPQSPPEETKTSPESLQVKQTKNHEPGKEANVTAPILHQGNQTDSKKGPVEKKRYSHCSIQ